MITSGRGFSTWPMVVLYRNDSFLFGQVAGWSSDLPPYLAAEQRTSLPSSRKEALWIFHTGYVSGMFEGKTA